MCGIFAISCNGDEAGLLILDSLQSLEYRGYDSAGMILVEPNGKFAIIKAIGEVANLRTEFNKQNYSGSVGIGHTRWATHGNVSVLNTHPHVVGDVAIVHNGIIENNLEIASFLEQNGIHQKTSVDTELIPLLIDFLMTTKGMSFNVAFSVVCTQIIKGSCAVVGLHKANSPEFACFKNNAPLSVAITSNGSFIASSDIESGVHYLADKKVKVHYLQNNECVFFNTVSGELQHIVSVGTDGSINELLMTKLPNFAKLILTQPLNLKLVSIYADQKCGYANFMEKEIAEQPDIIQHTANSVEMPKLLSNIQNICFVGCGSSYNVGAILANTALKNGLSGEAFIASELGEEMGDLWVKKYNPQNTVFVFISQSGETMDTIIALKKIKDSCFITVGILNKRNSSMEGLCDHRLFFHYTKEVSVAATKSFTSQLVVGMLLIQHLRSGTIDTNTIIKCADTLRGLFSNSPSVSSELEEDIEEVAGAIYASSGMFFIGRSLALPLCMEGSLKMKEVSYIHCEALYAGELKHGHIALIDNNFTTIVPVVYNNEEVNCKTMSNVEEILARNGKVLVISKNRPSISNANLMYIKLPQTLSELEETFVVVIVMQILAYKVARLLKLPIDKPRNLAKSVTVE